MQHVKTLEWIGEGLRLIDQTLLPAEEKFITIQTQEAMWEAIRKLRVRGAPAIGVAAAYGVYLGTVQARPSSTAAARTAALKSGDYLATSRPTAVNLFWAIERMKSVAKALPDSLPLDQFLAKLLAEAQALDLDDQERCRLIGMHGAPLLAGARGVLTHCNAGALATAGCGTALSVIYSAAETAKFTVYADETRPLLQGARLTAWELQKAGIETRLITDNTAGSVLQRGMVQAIVVGADRIAANGDAANKVGTMPLAIVAKYYGVPFYVAAPLSTFDATLKSGAGIPIEERDHEEVTHLNGQLVAPKGTKAFTPAFDVTPADLIAAIVTEVGVLRAPYGDSIAKALKEEKKRK